MALNFQITAREIGFEGIGETAGFTALTDAQKQFEVASGYSYFVMLLNDVEIDSNGFASSNDESANKSTMIEFIGDFLDDYLSYVYLDSSTVNHEVKAYVTKVERKVADVKNASNYFLPIEDKIVFSARLEVLATAL